MKHERCALEIAGVCLGLALPSALGCAARRAGHAADVGERDSPGARADAAMPGAQDANQDGGGAGPADGYAIPAGARRYVSVRGSDDADGSETAPWRSIAHALERTAAGTILVGAGSYPERLIIRRVGQSEADYLNLVAQPGEEVRLIGSGAGAGEERNMIYLEGASYVRILGFRIVGSGNERDASGVRVFGSGHHLEIAHNEISELRGESAMGITVYGQDGAGISELVVRANHIHDCEPAPSEALVVNGNVRGFQIADNWVRDVDNIGIDVIGGEAWLSSAFPADGSVIGNRVERANSSYDGSAAGIYVDGASRLTVERNTVTACDFGIEIGAERAGVVASEIVVRNNFVFRNFQGGIIFGGYEARRGRVRGARFVHNSLYKNARPGERTPYGYEGAANGEIIVQYGEDCDLTNNILYGVAEAPSLVTSWGESSNLRWGYNLYYREGGKGDGDPKGEGDVSADPRYRDPERGDLHLRLDSPAREAGGSDSYSGDLDIDGEARTHDRAEIGADEI